MQFPNPFSQNARSAFANSLTNMVGTRPVGSPTSYSISATGTTPTVNSAGSNPVGALNSPATQQFVNRMMATPAATPQTTGTPSAVNNSVASSNNTTSNPTSTVTQNTNQGVATPAVPTNTTSTATNPYSQAMQDYATSLKTYNNFKTDYQNSENGIAGRVEPNAAIAGEKGLLARNNAVKEQNLQGDVTNAENVLNRETTNKQNDFNNNMATEKFNEDKREFGLKYALDKQKQDADLAATSTTTEKSQSDALGTIGIVDSLLQNLNLSGISGVIDNEKPGILMGANARTAKNQFNQVKGLLALENRSKLKGQGAVSDFEGRILDNAASALGRNLSDDEFVKQLKQVKGSIATSHGLSAPIIISDPSTGERFTDTYTSAQIANARKNGFLIEYN